jgi:hypothetical protein
MSKYWHLSAGKMKVFSLGLLILSVLAVNAHAQSILGTAGSYAVLGGGSVTNTGTTTLGGDLGVSPGTSITGGGGCPAAGCIVFSSGTTDISDAATAQSNASSAYTTMMGLASSGDDLGAGVVQLGGATLNAGVYSIGAALLTGTLNLDFTGGNQSIVIDIGSTLTTASGPGAASVNLVGATSTDSVYWVVGSTATIGTYTSFMGNIIALSGVQMETNATDTCGSVIALSGGAVTLDANTIDTGCNGTLATTVVGTGPGSGTGYTTVPEGGSPLLYLCFSLLPIGTMLTFRFRRSI